MMFRLPKSQRLWKSSVFDYYPESGDRRQDTGHKMPDTGCKKQRSREVKKYRSKEETQ